VPTRAGGKTISVVICAYTHDRWRALEAAVESVAGQTTPALETIVVIDHNDELLARAVAELRGAVVVANSHSPGLSGGRQTGVDRSRGSIVAFLDDDAAADRDWLEQLIKPYEDPLVLGVGGLVEPGWEIGPPRWLPPEFYWVVGCSYGGLPTSRSQVRNPIGANMSVRASVVAAAGAFDPRLGRGARAGSAFGAAEETEFCIRARRAYPGHYWIYEPLARVVHRVPRERATFRYFARRCVQEGSAKALIARIAGSEEGLEAERGYVRSVLPRAVARELRGALRRRPGSLGRAVAIPAGLLVTAAAYGGTRLGGASARD
jgi:glycosyltransferase involved in cell wall biosynthesis